MRSRHLLWPVNDPDRRRGLHHGEEEGDSFVRVATCHKFGLVSAGSVTDFGPYRGWERCRRAPMVCDPLVLENRIAEAFTVTTGRTSPDDQSDL